MTADYFKKYKYRLIIKVLLIIIAAVLSFSLLFLLASNTAFGGILKRIFYSFNPSIVRFLAEHEVEVFLVGLVIVVTVTWIITQMRIINQLNQIVNSIDAVFNKKELLIQLPPRFKDVEMKLNSIKYENERNERLAKEAEQRKNDLVVYLAHDLKTPLTSVIGYLNLINDEKGISDELRQKYISISLEKAERLEDLINEFFEITRFNLQGITINKARLSLSIMINQIAEEFYPILSERDISCSIKVPGDIYIAADGDKMARVFDNLLKNASNYSFDGTKISVTADRIDTGVRIRFRNRGEIIPPQQLGSIFEKFYRLDTARSSRTGGAGLGLAIAREIVEMHGGTISVVSNSEYTEFEVRLPSID